MKNLLIFISLIVVFQTTSATLTPFQIAEQIETKISTLITKKNLTGLATLFSNDFKFRQCDGSEVTRDQRIESMSKNRFTMLPASVVNSARMINNEELECCGEEMLNSGDTMYTNSTLKKIDEKWIITYGVVDKCGVVN